MILRTSLKRVAVATGGSAPVRSVWMMRVQAAWLMSAPEGTGTTGDLGRLRDQTDQSDPAGSLTAYAVITIFRAPPFRASNSR